MKNRYIKYIPYCFIAYIIVGCSSISTRQTENATPLDHPNYPSPFSPTTVISFEVPKKQFVTLALCDTLGLELVKLVADTLKKGRHYAKIDTSFPVGHYFLKLCLKDTTISKKVFLLK